MASPETPHRNLPLFISNLLIADLSGFPLLFLCPDGRQIKVAGYSDDTEFCEKLREGFTFQRCIGRCQRFTTRSSRVCLRVCRTRKKQAGPIPFDKIEPRTLRRGFSPQRSTGAMTFRLRC